MTLSEIGALIDARIIRADERYGPFASTHEGMGVCLEEWHELIEAVHSNRARDIERECIDLAAALVRLCRDVEVNKKRSGLYVGS